MKISTQQPWHKGCAAILIVCAVGLALVTGLSSARWIGSSFPGFFVLENRVIASVSLPNWSVASSSRIYQHVIVAVNGQPVTTSEEIYTTVQSLPPGSLFAYTLEKDGDRSQVILPSQTFTVQDYFFFFGAYLFSGLSVALIGIGVWFLTPAAPASRALLLIGLVGGCCWSITAADLYAPYRFFRLHVLGEAFLPAGFLHLALVFPHDRFSPIRARLLVGPYVLSCLLGGAYEWFLYQPTAYSRILNLSMTYSGIATVVLFCKVIWDYRTTNSHLIRQRIRVILIGFLSGYALPALLLFASGLSGGEVPVNYMAFTASLFSLSLGYAIVKHDLFEIDAMLKRGTYYLTFTTIVTLCYIAFLAVLNLTLQSWRFAPLLFPLVVILLLNPLKDYLQKIVDRLFFRLPYNPKEVLEVTSASLAATLHLEEILPLLWQTIDDTMKVRQGGIFLSVAETQQYVLTYPRQAQHQTLPATHPLVQHVQRKGRALSLYDFAEASLLSPQQQTSVQGLTQLGAQLVVPLLFKGELTGLITLGQKGSGAFFSGDDVEFLSTLANQGALSIANARAYQEIQELNVGLEKKVEERTRALAHANTDLHASLNQLEHAYHELQRSQENLVRAEKMAAFGRMTAGIAHEMNTPLGSALNSLDLIQELVDEYTVSVGDPEVDEHDHREIAAEMNKHVRDVQQWVKKATRYIRGLKLQARGMKGGERRDFSVVQTLEDVNLLLAHRLRLSQCSLSVSCTAAEPVVYGDPSKLGQVFANLVVNAIDAYQDAGKEEGQIRIEVAEGTDHLEIRVCDQGCGIPPENLETIFQEFFSTKPLGKGTGLGLPIVRDILTSFFGGTIHVESVLGQGSTFVVRLPRHHTQQRAAHGAGDWAAPPLEERV